MTGKEITIAARDIIEPTGKYNSIITKAADTKALAFKTIDDKALQTISDWMPEVNRSTNAFNKQNSQTTASLMTLNMIDAGPYRTLRQILAQVEKKRGALKENIYNLEKKKLEYEDLQNDNLNRFRKEGEDVYDDTLYRANDLEMAKIASDIVDANGHIEAALKELGAYKQRYEEVCKNNDIPEDWDEQDFEDAEISHAIRSMFRNGIRDRMQGSHNMGTMEFFSQFGLNSVVAYSLVDSYLATVRQALSEGIKEGKLPTIEMEYAFLDKMVELFGEEYKRAMKRLGLDHITCAEFLFKDNA